MSGHQKQRGYIKPEEAGGFTYMYGGKVIMNRGNKTEKKKKGFLYKHDKGISTTDGTEIQKLAGRKTRNKINRKLFLILRTFRPESKPFLFFLFYS